MKAVILAGGYGTRISEESRFRPKPMVEIGDMPILWHIMKGYSASGINDFIICAGYKQHVIKEWFADYFLHTSDITFHFSNGNKMIVHNQYTEPWKVTIVDTGLDTQTGGRIKRIKSYIKDERFLLTYGDAVSDINIVNLLKYHEEHGRIATLSVYNFGQSKGVVDLNKNGRIESFREKSTLDGDMINIGYMVLEPQFLDYIDGDNTVLEQEPMKKLLEEHQLMGYIHKGFWQCMDTTREKEKLDYLWKLGKAPWKVWD